MHMTTKHCFINTELISIVSSV